MSKERITTTIDSPRLPFILRGHFNQSGKDSYPARVIPMGRIGRGLYAAYGSPVEGELEFLLSSREGVVNHGRELTRRLKDFDYRIHCLWAHTAKDVVLYEAEKYDVFYRQLLKDSQYAFQKPFLRLSLAEVVGEKEYRQEMQVCIKYLALNGHEDLITDFYDDLRKQQLEEGGFNLPERWQDLSI